MKNVKKTPTEQETDNLYSQAHQDFKHHLQQGDIISAEPICEEFFELEPDYLEEFL